jgi:diaminopimelate dehydrogenase
MNVHAKKSNGTAIRVGIVGYGNLGRGAEYAVAQNEDMDLRYIFTRRDTTSISPITKGAKVLSVDDAEQYVDEIDVMMLCGGSATDLPVQTPEFAKLFNVVDSYDAHTKIPEHYAKADKAAKTGKKVAIISAGWDPCVFSLNRVMSEAILTHGSTYTFWGKGVSQGHSDAIRQVDGVLDARQYTVPKESALDAVRNGENPVLSNWQKHKRVCYVVAKEGADLVSIENEIKSIPHYFADNDTVVHFISAEELAKEHSGLPHGGFVIRGGKTGANDDNDQIIEYRLKLDSNPEFTASVMTAFARAAYRLSKEGVIGCKTVFDIPPGYLIAKSAEELRREYL